MPGIPLGGCDVQGTLWTAIPLHARENLKSELKSDWMTIQVDFPLCVTVLQSTEFLVHHRGLSAYRFHSTWATMAHAVLCAQLASGLCAKDATKSDSAHV
jgi:hypothetical protein